MPSNRLAAWLCTCAVAGCVAPQSRRPIDVRSYASELLGPADPAAHAPPGELERTVLSAPELSLAGAGALALANRPDLAVAEAEIDVAAAARIRALLYPNPEASLAVEHGEAESSQVPQIWLEVAQPIVVSDRRQLGADEADAEAEAATWELFARRVEVLSAVRETWHEVAAAQRRITLAQENVTFAQELQRVAEVRLQAEQVPELEVLRARSEVERARLVVEVAEAHLAAARARLAGAMGISDGVLPPCPALAPEPPDLPDAGQLEAKALAESFAVRAAQARVRAAELAGERAEAEGIPDLTVSAGYGQSIVPLAALWTVGLGVPLPLFDRNQGGVAEAHALRARAEAEVSAAEAEVRAELREALAVYAGAVANLRAIRDTVAPLAEEAYRRTEIGYAEGRMDYLSLLDARRARMEASAAELEALLEAWLAVVRIESLVGPLAVPSEVQP
jgi:cobalt-zinc-cadmium efflux system outer membrane protein